MAAEPSLTFNQSVSGFVSFGGGGTATDALGLDAGPATVLAAQPATLTVHTTGTTGTLTMGNSSHGIVTGQRLDLYWVGGQAYNVTAGTVSGTSVPITVTGGGSSLPSAGTAVTVGIPVQTSFPVTGNNLTALVCGNPSAQAYFVFDNGATDDLALILAANQGYFWLTGGVGTNPLSGFTITSVWMSHSYTGGALNNMQAAALAH